MARKYEPTIIKAMKHDKLASLTYYSELTLDSKHIQKDNTKDIQALSDKYGRDSWALVSTNTASFGGAVFNYAYFEK